jgi:NADH-quinone oxidoreductase subunit N
MLAYSSIAHAGYLLVALWSGTHLGASAVMLYLGAYTLTTLAAFILLGSLGRNGERAVRFEDLAGLSRRRPWTAFALAICMLSLLGFPGTFGFIGKWYIIQAVVAAHQYILPVVLVITSVISAGYYLPVIMAMYMREPGEEAEWHSLRLPRPAAWVTGIAVVALVVFGVAPRHAIDVAIDSVRQLATTQIPRAGR